MIHPSRNERAERAGRAGREYWKSRLHRGGEVPGRTTKRLTHRKERRLGRQVVRSTLTTMEAA